MRVLSSPPGRGRPRQLSWFEGGPGACGGEYSDTDYIVALSIARWDNGSPCFKEISISYGGKTANAKIVDDVRWDIDFRDLIGVSAARTTGSTSCVGCSRTSQTRASGSSTATGSAVAATRTMTARRPRNTRRPPPPSTHHAHVDETQPYPDPDPDLQQTLRGAQLQLQRGEAFRFFRGGRVSLRRPEPQYRGGGAEHGAVQRRAARPRGARRRDWVGNPRSAMWCCVIVL
ncbi:hypothetical protein B0H10DRAFT_1327816 [Mycena sp. CBHHK59/15]|nr:hypothetical protein B0H10DRAFT_1327816 [Mycena sp. CBHHK59/15]